MLRVVQAFIFSVRWGEQYGQREEMRRDEKIEMMRLFVPDR
jgi:hypothetical protein